MRVRVYENSSPQMFNEMVYGPQHPANEAYFRQQAQMVSPTLTEYGRQFAQAAQQLYWNVHYSPAMRLARAAVRMVDQSLAPDRISMPYTVDDVRMAKPMMQTYIMAHPKLRENYHKQRCDGYADSYVDQEPGKVGAEHSHWRDAVSGLITVEDESWKSTTYFQDKDPSEKVLDTLDRHAIEQAWSLVDYALAKDKDPTDIFQEG